MNQLAANGTPVATTTISPHFPNPYSIQWYAGVQRQLPFGLVLDTAYVGNRALHLNMTRNANIPNRITGVIPDPAFGSFLFYDDSDSSWYDAWQTSLIKTFRHGLNFTVNFNWAHNISYGDADLQIETVPQDPNNLRAERGPTPFDIRRSPAGEFYLYAGDSEIHRLAQSTGENVPSTDGSSLGSWWPTAERRRMSPMAVPRMAPTGRTITSTSRRFSTTSPAHWCISTKPRLHRSLFPASAGLRCVPGI